MNRLLSLVSAVSMLMSVISACERVETQRETQIPKTLNDSSQMTLLISGGGCGHCSSSLIENINDMLAKNPGLLIRYCGSCYDLDSILPDLQRRLLDDLDPRDAARLDLKTGNALFVTDANGLEARVHIDPDNIDQVIARLLHQTPSEDVIR